MFIVECGGLELPLYWRVLKASQLLQAEDPDVSLSWNEGPETIFGINQGMKLGTPR